MARTQLLSSEKKLSVFFTGHADDQEPARSGVHEHIACICDVARRRLLILAPHLIERRARRADESDNWRRLEDAMIGFDQLRAGASGLRRLSRVSINCANDPLFASSREWRSATRYRVLRHRKRDDARRAFAEDLDSERERNSLPKPEISLIEVDGRHGGLAGTAMLRFSHAVSGPILIGRDRHFGGGLFAKQSE
jgi:CRISPR-associated protein Csb2